MDVRAEDRGRPHQKVRFPAAPVVGEFFDPWASGRKGQECPREIRTKKFMFMLFFLPLLEDVRPEGPFQEFWPGSPQKSETNLPRPSRR